MLRVDDIDIAIMKSLSDRELMILQSEMLRQNKSVGTAYFLWFFLGFFGAHKHYLGKHFFGMLYFVSLSTLGFAINEGALAVFRGSNSSAYTTLGAVSGLFLGISLVLDLLSIPWQVKDVNEKIKNDILSMMLEK